MDLEIKGILYFILAVPLVFSALALMGWLPCAVIHWLNRLAATLTAAAVGKLVLCFDSGTAWQGDYLYLDALSLWMLVILALLYLGFAFTSKAYLDRDTNIRYGYLRRFRHLEGRFYALSHMFVWTMLLVVLVNNLGLMWVTIEATTLVSALLVAFKFTRTSLEAAWKYVMVCTVGICLALLGTVILYYAQLSSLGGAQALDWTYLALHGGALNPVFTKLAFCFLFVGYGTKIGLAPMHAWLPDAHSEAPALTSGLLSGALCICAMYVLLRNMVVVIPAVGVGFVAGLCLFFGILTIGLAVPFVIVQRDVKRMLAYSSMENFGLMMAGFGLFLPLAVEGSLLHMMNHALVKYVLFYTAGTIMETYSTKNMMRIHGMMMQAPRTAAFWLVGIIGILGMPPLGIFFSKFFVLESFFLSGNYWLGVLVLLLLAGILIGILYHAMRMLGGTPARKAAGELMGCVDTVALAVLLFVSGAVSIAFRDMPYLGDIVSNAAKVILGGAV